MVGPVETADGSGARRTLLSLFAGCGGLDLGFEEAGFSIGLAYDRDGDAIASWNRNRNGNGQKRGHVFDLATIRLADMDRHFGSKFVPRGVIGGPPCQGFSRANQARHRGDARNVLLRQLFTLALRLHRHRAPLDFILVENVPELASAHNRPLLEREKLRLRTHGFAVKELELDASMYGVPQRRKRLFVLAVPIGEPWGAEPPEPTGDRISTVADAIRGLPEPMHYRRGVGCADIPYHPNHWCMRPRSRKFFDGSLVAGQVSGRSFKTLPWDAPSVTVAYGHREVHVHPSGKRRLSVFEGLRLQGFPKSYELEGSLSSQIDQVSDAVPPPLAEAVAKWIRHRMAKANPRTRRRP